MVRFLSFSLCLIGLATCTGQKAPVFPPNPVVPTADQVAWQRQEVIGFVHFTVNTFTNREWGEGTESPAVFNPVKLDARQWAVVAKDAGMKTLIITAKHHDGFCLWPSAYTTHSVQYSPWKNGKGDVVKELSEACHAYGLKMGIYLSPWDRHEPSYGTNDYNRYYMNQMQELLTHYGRISEFWMDGAKGKNAKNMEYDFPAWRAMIRKLQPHCLVFSDAGPGIRWIGNEQGVAGETNWAMIDTSKTQIGKADMAYLNRGDSAGVNWMPGECDVSIRPGWFYHASENGQVKTPQQLVDLYYKSVGRNSVLLLNMPPDTNGLIPEHDAEVLRTFRSILQETFRHNLATGAVVTATSQYKHHPNFAPSHVADGKDTTFWAAADNTGKPEIELTLPTASAFDRILLQEPIWLGQRISAFEVDAMVNGTWNTIARGTTIGYKRLLRIPPTTSEKIRIRILASNNIPALSEIGLYKASPEEPAEY